MDAFREEGRRLAGEVEAEPDLGGVGVVWEAFHLCFEIDVHVEGCTEWFSPGQ